MPQSVVNDEFVNIANRHFAKAGFARRRKGQRYMDKELLPTFLFRTDLQGHTIEDLGVGWCYGGFGDVVRCYHMVVTTPAGVRVPAYQIREHSYNICQELQYVPA